MTIAKNKFWLSWLVLGLITLALVAIAYLIFRPVTAPADQTSPPSMQTEAVDNAVPSGQTLQQALEHLSAAHGLDITLDNPYMEDCPYPADLEKVKSPKTILRQLARRFNMELHEAAPGEYLLIGGTCE